MTLNILLASPFVAALLLGILPERLRSLLFPFSLLLASVIVGGAMLLVFGPAIPFSESIPWFALPGTRAVVEFSLYSDGLSGWMILLSAVLTLSTLWVSHQAFSERFRVFSISVFLLQGALFGSFLASDLVLFFLFFEALVPPTVILIASFGGPNRKRAATLFAVFTLAGSLPMAIAIWAIAGATGTTAGMQLPQFLQGVPVKELTLFFWAFVIAFAVKTPLVPFHGWQAETYTEAPGGVTALLSGAMAKVGVFGFLRWTIPLFPQAAMDHQQALVLVGIITMIYASLVALRQTDFKRVLVFSSLGHLGLAVVGCFTLSQSGVNGVLVLLVAHGLSAGALFLLGNIAESWTGSRSLADFGGLAKLSPVFATLFVIACMAAVAVPGTMGFIGEFLILQAVWQSFGPVPAFLAGLGAILSAAYTLRLVQRMVFGTPNEKLAGKKIGHGDLIAISPLVIALFLLGFFPGTVIRSIDASAAQGPTAVATDSTESLEHVAQR